MGATRRVGGRRARIRQVGAALPDDGRERVGAPWHRHPRRCHSGRPFTGAFPAAYRGRGGHRSCTHHSAGVGRLAARRVGSAVAARGVRGARRRAPRLRKRGGRPSARSTGDGRALVRALRAGQPRPRARAGAAARRRSGARDRRSRTAVLVVGDGDAGGTARRGRLRAHVDRRVAGGGIGGRRVRNPRGRGVRVRDGVRSPRPRRAKRAGDRSGHRRWRRRPVASCDRRGRRRSGGGAVPAAVGRRLGQRRVHGSRSVAPRRR